MPASTAVPPSAVIPQVAPHFRMARFLMLAALIVATAACGEGLPTSPEELILIPACAAPAPLYAAESRRFPNRIVDDYLVTVRSPDNVSAEAARLASTYGFSVTRVQAIAQLFVAPLDPRQVAKLRCEPSVSSLVFEHNTVAPSPVP
jgi:hypothetical protein